MANNNSWVCPDCGNKNSHVFVQCQHPTCLENFWWQQVERHRKAYELAFSNAIQMGKRARNIGGQE